jgi:hypothetical protein
MMKKNKNTKRIAILLGYPLFFVVLYKVWSHQYFKNM